MATIRIDEPSLAARNDHLIKKVGTMLVEKHGINNVQDTSQKIRELGRLLIQLRKSDANPNAQLSDFIKPSKFDVVIEAVKTLCNFEIKDGQQDVQIPSLALKIGNSLKKCVNAIRGQALRSKDKDSEEDVDNFEKLSDTEWSSRISHHSLATLSMGKYNKVDMLPLAEDLDKLRKYIVRNICESAEAMHNKPQLDDWSLLAQSTLTRVVMFNKRRRRGVKTNNQSLFRKARLE